MMSDALKQRLMGAAVLMIFSGLLWPLLFDFEQRPEAMPAIPPAPEVAVVEVVEPAAIVRESQSAVKSTPQVAGDVANSPQALLDEVPRPAAIGGREGQPAVLSDAQRPRLDEQGVPLAFVVQVGSFSQWENAEALRSRLLEKELKAYIEPPLSTVSGPYAVLVGPSLTLARAEQLAEKIERQLALKETIIKRFGGQR